MKRVVNVFLLNFLWIIFSIPLVTIGASSCAAFYVCMKIVDDNEVHVFKDFLKAFKTNFKQGTLLWAFTAPCIYALCLMWPLIKDGEGNFITITGAVVFTVIVIFALLYSYPMIARYENNLKKIIRNSIGISFQYFKKTIILVVILAAELIVFYLIKNYMILLLLLAPEFFIYTISFFAKGIFNDLEQTVKSQRDAE